VTETNPRKSSEVEESKAPSDLEEVLNLSALERFLAERLPATDRGLRIEGQAAAGSSNITVFITWGDEHLVVRRPPAGPLLPTAHDVLREYRFISTLYGTGVPVPEPIIACEDPAIIGAPFYVMKRVDGVCLREYVPAELDTLTERRRIGEEAVDALAALHSVDWAGRGLRGKPEGYLDRQIKRWSSQLELTPTAQRLHGLDKVTAWVKDNRPESGQPTIVHGDWGLQNMLFASAAPTSLRAVLDWEMATVGDPLADVAWFLLDWGIVPQGIHNPAHRITVREGFLRSDEMIARYQERGGRRVENYKFYQVFSMWKLAIIGEGLYASYVAGTAPDPSVARLEHETLQQVERVLQLIESG